MTFADFKRYSQYTARENKQRLGQAYFNCLYELRPKLCDLVRGTPHDPFYDDRKIPYFLDFVEKLWKDV